jgi:hypothetical protein
MSNAFLPKFASAKSLSVSGSSGSTTLASDCPQVRLWNDSVAACYVIWGVGSQTATTSHMALAPGAIETFTKQDADTIAAIGSSGTLRIICGHGN